MKIRRLAIALSLSVITLSMMILLTTGPSRAWADGGANPFAAAPAAPPFAGTFVSDKVSIVLAAAADGTYTGEIKLGGKAFPAKAHDVASGIEGTFRSDGHDFPFTASLANQALVFETAGHRYELKRADAPPPQNPLAVAGSPSGAGATPSGPSGNAPPLAAVALPAGFSELGVTGSGRSVFVKYADVKSVDALIQRLGDELGKMFDAKPQFTSAYVDSRTKGKGLASFTAAIKGTPVKGIIVFGVDPQAGSSATVVYSRPDAPKEEMDVLMATVPARPVMQTMQFPDKSGSIDLPAGWTAKMQSLTAGSWFITGPKRQVILVNVRIPVDTPDSFRVKVARQNYDSAVRLWEMGGRRGPAPVPLEQRLANLTISPYLNPEDAFNTILPAIAQKQRQAGQTWVEYGKAAAVQKVDPNPQIPGAEAAVIACTSVIHIGDKTTDPVKQLIKIETAPHGDTWVMVMGSYIAPEATFDRDLPIMADIVASAKLDDGAVQRQLDRDNQAFQAMTAYYAAKHEALMQRGREFIENQQELFEHNQQLVRAQAQARHDANSDMQEMASGLRDIYDTATGQMTRVNLYAAAAIAAAWNDAANDPTRYIQIPLRYER